MGMRMKKIVAINGEFFCRNITGIERLAIEVTSYLDHFFEPGMVELVVPRNARNMPVYKNIKVITIPIEADFFPKWTQIYFQKYILKHHRLSLDYSNTCPFFSPGIEFIHDIYCKLYPQDFHTLRDRLIALYSDVMYHVIAKRAKRIVTVSEYTKQTLVDTYHINPNRVSVVYSGLGAYLDIPRDDSVYEKFPQLKKNKFYFTLGSLSTRKNLKWIARHAEVYPDEIFAISGKAIPSVVAPELQKLNSLKNVVMTGYLTDGQVKSLLAKCRAFILPSYFEGFGLPPLEALSCGAKIIISNKTSLPEIYGDAAHYIDPDNPEINLDDLLKQKVSKADALLEKYTLENTARRLYEIIQKVNS